MGKDEIVDVVDADAPYDHHVHAADGTGHTDEATAVRTRTRLVR